MILTKKTLLFLVLVPAAWVSAIPSQQCTADYTALLTNNPGVNDGLVAPTDCETPDETKSYSICTYTADGSQEAACTSAGGTFYEFDYMVECNVVGQSGAGFRNLYNNMPQCGPPTCSADDIAFIVDGILLTLKTSFELDGDLTCTSNVDESSSGGGGGGGGGSGGTTASHPLILAIVVMAFQGLLAWDA